jgi:hypothetical protein
MSHLLHDYIAAQLGQRVNKYRVVPRLSGHVCPTVDTPEDSHGTNCVVEL